MAIVTVKLRNVHLVSAVELPSLMLSSDATLQQLVLVGSPPHQFVSRQFVDTLKSLNFCQVILFDDGSDMKQWIDQVQEFLLEGTFLTALDRVDDLRRIVPAHDDTSLDRLKASQASHLSTGAASQDASAISQRLYISSQSRISKDTNLQRAGRHPVPKAI
ncbi:hypothetical protein BG015_001143 [Linnemannia schmuckeri]|uniref:Uncharacterized protein n=1 Tax=Linnemannia schmuckeri TaxID=64567 RepID=A0A9P5VDU7_9FUNG|nr:hypothetical protein BG015_001143 [Linnemannia schmuckeri]